MKCDRYSLTLAAPHIASIAHNNRQETIKARDEMCYRDAKTQVSHVCSTSKRR